MTLSLNVFVESAFSFKKQFAFNAFEMIHVKCMKYITMNINRKAKENKKNQSLV